MDEIVDLNSFKEHGLKKVIGKLNGIIKAYTPNSIFNHTRLNQEGTFIVNPSSAVEIAINEPFYCKSVTVSFALVDTKRYKTIGVDLIVFDSKGNSVVIQARGENIINGCKVSYFDVDRVVTRIDVKNTKPIIVTITEVNAIGASPSVIEDRLNDYSDYLTDAVAEIKNFISSIEMECHKYVEHANKDAKAFEEISSKLVAVNKRKGDLDKKIEEQRKVFEANKADLYDLEILNTEKKKELEQLEGTLSELNLKLANLSGSENEIKIRIQDERQKQEKLSQEVEIAEANVARLKRQEQLYSEDFSSIRRMFNSHGRLYLLLIILASSGVLWVMFRIYEAALNIAITSDVANPVTIFGVLVSRLPVALVNILVVGVLVKLIWVLVARLLDNNNSLVKINQMAYLVRESVEEHKEDFKDESSENKQRMRTQMKTSLIRDFMCGEPQRKSEGSSDMAKAGDGIELSKLTDALQELIKLVKP